uniref:Uncharacterized protein n=1 Tax=Octactis speculum TaxID=3111310 RepID=A0A7S2FXV9_9STRA
MDIESDNDIQCDVLGKEQLEFWSRCLERADQDLSGDTDSKHVLFQDLLSNPVQVVKDIYADFGLEYSDAYDKKLHEYLEENEKKRASKSFTKAKKFHQYTLADYALNQAKIDAKLGWYKEKYLNKE